MNPRFLTNPIENKLEDLKTERKLRHRVGECMM